MDRRFLWLIGVLAAGCLATPEDLSRSSPTQSDGGVPGTDASVPGDGPPPDAGFEAEACRPTPVRVARLSTEPIDLTGATLLEVPSGALGTSTVTRTLLPWRSRAATAVDVYCAGDAGARCRPGKVLVQRNVASWHPSPDERETQHVRPMLDGSAVVTYGDGSTRFSDDGVVQGSFASSQVKLRASGLVVLPPEGGARLWRRNAYDVPVIPPGESVTVSAHNLGWPAITREGSRVRLRGIPSAVSSTAPVLAEGTHAAWVAWQGIDTDAGPIDVWWYCVQSSREVELLPTVSGRAVARFRLTGEPCGRNMLISFTEPNMFVHLNAGEESTIHRLSPLAADSQPELIARGPRAQMTNPSWHLAVVSDRVIAAYRPEGSPTIRLFAGPVGGRLTPIAELGTAAMSFRTRAGHVLGIASTGLSTTVVHSWPGSGSERVSAIVGHVIRVAITSAGVVWLWVKHGEQSLLARLVDGVVVQTYDVSWSDDYPRVFDAPGLALLRYDGVEGTYVLEDPPRLVDTAKLVSRATSLEGPDNLPWALLERPDGSRALASWDGRGFVELPVADGDVLESRGLDRRFIPLVNQSGKPTPLVFIERESGALIEYIDGEGVVPLVANRWDPSGSSILWGYGRRIVPDTLPCVCRAVPGEPECVAPPANLVDVDFLFFAESRGPVPIGEDADGRRYLWLLDLDWSDVP